MSSAFAPGAAGAPNYQSLDQFRSGQFSSLVEAQRRHLAPDPGSGLRAGQVEYGDPRSRDLAAAHLGKALGLTGSTYDEVHAAYLEKGPHGAASNTGGMTYSHVRANDKAWADYFGAGGGGTGGGASSPGGASRMMERTAAERAQRTTGGSAARTLAPEEAARVRDNRRFHPTGRTGSAQQRLMSRTA